MSREAILVMAIDRGELALHYFLSDFIEGDWGIVPAIHPHVKLEEIEIPGFGVMGVAMELPGTIVLLIPHCHGVVEEGYGLPFYLDFFIGGYLLESLHFLSHVFMIMVSIYQMDGSI